ncbi:MAG: APC family permease [Rhizonema sp. PD37]|nr:APC family permease [Rhizonema sp. PD37]
MVDSSSQTRSGGEAGLKSGCLGFKAILSLAIANIAPATTPTLNLPKMFSHSGNGTWLAFLLATIGLVLVSLNINQFASRKASSGSMYTYVAQGLGPTLGVLCGWSLSIGYIAAGMAVLSGFVSYVNVLLQPLGFQVFPVLLFAIGTGLAWFLAYKGIELSTTLMLGIQLISVALILIIAWIVLKKHGFAPDMAQLSLRSVSLPNLQLGLVLAVFSFVGFESATTLGEEAKNPLKYIPRAVLSSTVGVGLFFIITSYVEILGFSSSKVTLDQSKAPLNILANQAGVGFFGVPISLGAAISLFASTLGSLTAGGRILLSMSRHKLLHRAVGRVHRRNQTPHVAIALSAVLTFLVPTILSLRGIEVMKIFEYTGSFSAYGFLLAYILVSVAAPIYLRKQRRLRRRNVVVAVVAVLFLLIPVVGSVYPVPPAPLNVLPVLFLVLMILCSSWFVWRRWREPEIINEIKRDVRANHS